MQKFNLKRYQLEKHHSDITINFDKALTDPEEQEKMVYKYLNLLKKIAKINNKIDEDLLQELFELMLDKALKTYDGHIKFSTWVVYLARNHKKNYIQRNNRRKHQSLNSFIDAETELIDILPNDIDLEQNLIREKIFKFLNREIKKLKPKHQKIIKKYYGFEKEKPHTLKEIANIFDCDFSYIYQEKRKALDYLDNKMQWVGIL
ncbi:MAG: sigma-70 family RNA polymerase sigma factor [Bacteroidales bacterium]